MEQEFTIPIYSEIAGKFEVIDTVIYQLTYCKGHREHQMNIVVNGKRTDSFINLVDPREKFRRKILTAIKQYQSLPPELPLTKKIWTIDAIQKEYGDKVVHRFHVNLFPINKEYYRDKLTEYDLIHYNYGTKYFQGNL